MNKIVLLLILLFIHFLSLEAQELDEILKKHFKAHHQDVWEQINTFNSSVIWKSTLGYYKGFCYSKKPNKTVVRNVKSDFSEGYNSQEYWTIGQWNKNKIETLNDSKKWIIENLIYFGSPLFGMNSLKFKGIENLENEVSINKKNYFVISNEELGLDFYIEKESYLLYQVVYNFIEKDKNVKITRIIKQYSDYQGLKMPIYIVFNTDDFFTEYTFDNIILGKGLKDSLFKKPSKTTSE